MKRIDVHHHAFPRTYIQALKGAGVKNTMGVDFPEWTPETSLKQMDKNQIQIAMLSISAPGVYFNGMEFPDGFSEELARLGNEAIADTKKKYPDRFGGFATIPMLNTKSAIDELAFALDKLELDGITLMTNYKGIYLGDEKFETFFENLNKRNAIVFIHPTEPGPQFDPGLDIPVALIEAPFDTTRAVANLMFNGVLDRYPNITYIVSHGGGTIPFLAWRLAGIEYAQKDKKVSVLRALYDYLLKGKPDKGLRCLKSMYFDTAIVSGNYALNALRDFAGSEHIVYGSDLCIAKLSQIITKNLKRDGNFSLNEYNAISYGNCLRLFPALSEYFSKTGSGVDEAA